jgi:DNA-binding FadR family transcriptional regulator
MSAPVAAKASTPSVRMAASSGCARREKGAPPHVTQHPTHHSFVLATHNAVLIRVSHLLIDTRRQPIWGGLKKRTFNPELHLRYCAEHDHIVEAIADRDPDSARQAMRTHLCHVRRILLGDND